MSGDRCLAPLYEHLGPIASQDAACTLAEGHSGEHVGALCGPACAHPNNAPADSAPSDPSGAPSIADLMDPAKAPSWPTDYKAPAYEAERARYDAYLLAREVLTDEIAYARTLARQWSRLPPRMTPPAVPENDPRYAAWRALLVFRLARSLEASCDLAKGPTKTVTAADIEAISRHLTTADEIIDLLTEPGGAA